MRSSLTLVVIFGVALLPAVLSPASARGGRPELPADLDHRDARKRLVAVGKLAEIPGPEAFRALVGALGDEAPAVVDRAVEALAGRNDPEERAWIARHATRAGAPAVRAALARVIAADAAAADGGMLVELLDDREAAVRAIAAATLGRIGGSDHAKPLARRLDDREPSVRVAALEAVVRIDPANAATRLEAATEDGDPAVRAAAILALGDRRTPEGDARLCEALEDRSWSVQVAAAKSLARVRSAASIPPLLDAFERERGRVRDAVRMALWSITGNEFPDDVALWRRWWDREGASFTPPPIPPGRGGRTGDGSAAAFHSIPVSSEVVTFVIDTSRSMREPLRDGDPTTKWDTVRRDLGETVARLSGDTRFNVVLFGTKVRAWQPRPVPAGASARARLRRFLESVEPAGWTNLYDAVERALGDADVHTLYVLTDGAPSVGRYVRPGDVRGGIAALNRLRMAQIHTIDLGATTAGKRWEGLLEGIAEGNDGVSVRR